MIICGIDEAGRGPLAGPVVVAGFINTKNYFNEAITDSKKIYEADREVLYEEIVTSGCDYFVTRIDHDVIDEINILAATMRGMETVAFTLKEKCEKFYIDGNYFKLKDNRHNELNYETVIEGDAKIFEISCASILAKVTRDRIMRNYEIEYPQYKFGKHKGYATPEHIGYIKEFGLTPIHRKSFCTDMFGLREKCVYKNRLGKAGEFMALQFLKKAGYTHLKSNYRYDRAEIDLIFTGEKEIIFAEVKTRKNKKFGEGEESVDARKQNQIKKAIEGFLYENESYRDHQIRIDVLVVYLINRKTNIIHIPNAFY
jgi:ribonuclease HII